jgi:hypothetical protein
VNRRAFPLFSHTQNCNSCAIRLTRQSRFAEQEACWACILVDRCPSLDHLFTSLQNHVLLDIDALRRRVSPLRAGMGRVEVGKTQRLARVSQSCLHELRCGVHSGPRRCSASCTCLSCNQNAATGRTVPQPSQCMHVNLHTQLKRACARVVCHIELYGGCAADTA